MLLQLESRLLCSCDLLGCCIKDGTRLLQLQLGKDDSHMYTHARDWRSKGIVAANITCPLLLVRRYVSPGNAYENVTEQEHRPHLKPMTGGLGNRSTTSTLVTISKRSATTCA